MEVMPPLGLSYLLQQPRAHRLALRTQVFGGTPEPGGQCQVFDVLPRIR